MPSSTCSSSPGRTAVRKFYWVQFEHFLPTNQLTYGYAPTRTAEIGDFRFIYDVKSFSDYAAMQTSEPASDGAAMSRGILREVW